MRGVLGTFAHRKVAVLGIAFKADTDDVRDNLTAPLVNVLEREGAVTFVYDPLVPGYDDVSVLEGADAVVVMTAHSAFKRWTEDDLMRQVGRNREETFVYDLWNIWPWADRVLGKGIDDHYENSGYGSQRLPDARGRSASAR